MTKKLEINFTKKPEMVFQFDQFLNVEQAVDKFLNKKENLERLIAPLIPTNLEETIQKLIPEVEDGKTPIKGIDYNDGKDGETPDEETLLELIKTQIPEPIPGNDGKTPEKGVDYFTKKELEDIKKGLKEAIMSEMTNHITKEEVNIRLEEIKKQVNSLPQSGGAQFLRQLMDVNVGVPTAQQYGLTYNPSRSEFSLTAITGGGGAVDSVNGQTGVVVLDQDDIGDGATYKQYSATEKTKLAGIETGADVTDATNVGAAGAFMKSVDDTDDITVGSTNKFATAAEKTKLGHITVTQAVDLDTMESDIAALANGMVYKGNWDASAGTFPGAGVAQTGWFYTVSVGGTVDSVVFVADDRLVATTDNASATVYAGNWTKLDATDAVTSIFGRTGNVVATSGDYTTAIVADSADKRYVTDAQLTVIGNTSGTNSGNQTITNSSDATSHTVTLSASGGSVQLIEGTNITLTTGGTASAGTVTIAATGSSGATTALDNLASVAINTSLVSDTDNTDDLGTTLKKWANLFVTTIGATATRVTKGWFTDLEVTNAITGSITGNSATVTTNANLTGDVTSTGNATTIANSAVTLAKMANLAQDQFIGRTTASTGVPETATITAAARTVLDDTTVAAMVDTLGGATSTGTGGIARATSPTFVTPALGTPSALVGTNITGTASGLTAGDSTKIGGITVTGTPAVGYVPTATSTSAATWQMPSSPLTVEYSFSTAFETTTRGVPQTSGSGNTVTATSGGLRCNGGSANGYASSKIPMGQTNGFKVFSGNPKFSAQMYWTYSKSGGNDEVTIAFCGIGDPGTSLTSEAFVTNHIGFMVTSTAGGVLNLYATNANGSTQTKSASLETAVTGTNYEFFISVTSDTNIAYYWRKNGGSWSSVLNHTTNIPSSSTSEQHCTVGLIHTEAITGSDNDAYIGGMTYKR